MTRIYLARPISGESFDDVVGYYTALSNELSSIGYDVLYPMVGKGELRTEIKFKSEGYGNPESTNHAIVARDNWMVSMADLVFIDLVGASRVSIGCMCELAWAYQQRKHIVLVLEDGNIHDHAFVLEQASIVYREYKQAMAYLRKFAKKEV